jgi:hypothetical protein
MTASEARRAATMIERDRTRTLAKVVGLLTGDGGASGAEGAWCHGSRFRVGRVSSRATVSGWSIWRLWWVWTSTLRVACGTAAGPITEEADGDRFHADIAEVVHTHLNEAATMLVVEWWTPRHGLRTIERE